MKKASEVLITLIAQAVVLVIPIVIIIFGVDLFKNSVNNLFIRAFGASIAIVATIFLASAIRIFIDGNYDK